MKFTKDKKIKSLLDYLDRKKIYFETYEGISEPGYEDKCAISADWNGVPQNICTYIEDSLNLEILWCDEWAVCSKCGKAVRTSPDSYGWQASYEILNDCELFCRECIEANPEAYIDDIISGYVNNANRAVRSWLIEHIENAGFICFGSNDYCNRYETGFYPGQTDDPRKVASEIKENLPDHDYLFAISGVGQFDIKWSVYIRPKNNCE